MKAGGTRYPVFIPEECRTVKELLIQGSYQAAIDRLEHDARLGSMSAGALLGYLYLQGAVSGLADLSLAEELCLPAARRGYPYAQFVMGWVERSRERYGAGSEWLGKAAERAFLPALADNARLMAAGLGFKGPPDSRAALGMLWLAIRRGYLPFAPYAVAIFRMKSATFKVRIACLLLITVGVPLFAYSLLFENYSERGFFHYRSPAMQVFRRPEGA